MLTFHAPSFPTGNRLLARLPSADHDRLRLHLRVVTLDHGQVLYESHSVIKFAYFPIGGVTSALNVMSDGSAIEVATVGDEGMVGLAAFFGGETSPNRVIAQIAGDALRIETDVLKREANGDGPLRRLLIRYNSAFQAQVSQSVACNGLHVVQQRCCRWLLMTHDRVHTDDVALTHEYLAIMLGVRRPSVTEVLRPLQKLGLIRSHRGVITILDRKGLEGVSCECYRVVCNEYERLLVPLSAAS